jgi:hypothetical protein
MLSTNLIKNVLIVFASEANILEGIYSFFFWKLNHFLAENIFYITFKQSSLPANEKSYGKSMVGTTIQ